MITADEFILPLRQQGYEWYAGVPCSFLTPLINYVISTKALHYVSAANEGDAIAIAAGASIGGKKSVALMQNSGLGNAISPLTSLIHTFKIPVLLICTHRGEPGLQDEPQHELMGSITKELFDCMGIGHENFPQATEKINATLANIFQSIEVKRKPYSLIMRKGSVANFNLAEQSPRKSQEEFHYSDEEDDSSQLLTRNQVLQSVVENTKGTNTVVIATTGYTGRELYSIVDLPNYFYMVGSMGCASSLGLGLALSRPDLRVLVIDGDGAALMRLGNLATIGSYNPPNFSHLLLDNEVHDSTGGQATVSRDVQFDLIAAACSYSNVWRSNKLDVLNDFLTTTSRNGTRFMHMKIQPGASNNLPRPTISPSEVLIRLKNHIG
jgi:phosphonopyruvate decarboxylase